MAIEYALSSRVQVKFTGTWTDTQGAFSLSEVASIQPSIALENGTGDGQGNGTWQHAETVASQQTYTLDLTNLESEVFGGIGPIDFAVVKFIYIENQGPEGVTVGNWTPWTGATGTVSIPSGGYLIATNTNSGWSTSADATLQIINQGTQGASVRVLLAGVLN